MCAEIQRRGMQTCLGETSLYSLFPHSLWFLTLAWADGDMVVVTGGACSTPRWSMREAQNRHPGLYSTSVRRSQRTGSKASARFHLCWLVFAVFLSPLDDRKTTLTNVM